MSIPAPAAERHEFEAVAARYMAALDDSRLQQLAGDLRVSVTSLLRLRVGWSATDRAYTFPMVNAAGETTGIRLRLPDGRKLSVRGSHEGLFIPSGLNPTDRLLIVEGPTDAAALLDLGFDAVGRPNCRGGTSQLLEFVRRHRIGEVVIVADGDGPGLSGAKSLVASMLTCASIVRLVLPPTGIKDSRDWKRAGATRQDIEAAISEAPEQGLVLCVQRRHRHGR